MSTFTNVASPSAPTTRTIAEACGLSPATVSYALRNHPKIGSETRSRVWAMAEKLGYRVNPLVNTWMAHVRTTKPAESRLTLAFLGTTVRQLKDDPHSRRVYLGAQARARQLGFDLDTLVLKGEGMTERRFNGILKARGISGLIIPNVTAKGVTHLHLDLSRIAAISVTHTLVSPALHRVHADTYQGMWMLLRHVRKLGYRRVGLFFPGRFAALSQRFSLAAFALYQTEVHTENRVPVHDGGEMDREAFLGWFRRNRPDVVISPMNPACLWLQEIGLKVPADIGFATTFYHSAEAPTHSGIDNNAEEIGATAVEYLSRMLQHNETGVPRLPRLTLVPPTLVEGATLRSTTRAVGSCR